MCLLALGLQLKDVRAEVSEILFGIHSYMQNGCCIYSHHIGKKEKVIKGKGEAYVLKANL